MPQLVDQPAAPQPAAVEERRAPIVAEVQPAAPAVVEAQSTAPAVVEV
jgi:hypothetical protein